MRVIGGHDTPQGKHEYANRPVVALRSIFTHAHFRRPYYGCGRLGDRA